MRSAASATAPLLGPPGVISLGDDNTTACPPGLAVMASAAACQFAVYLAGSPYTYSGTVAVSYLPKGCVWLKAGGVFYFNDHATGAPRPLAQPVCAGAPYPAPHTRTCVSAHVCVSTRTGAECVAVTVPRHTYIYRHTCL
jgi:hypothetical protein